MNCIFCSENVKKKDHVRVVRGVPALIEISKSRNDNLWYKIKDLAWVDAHKKCRREYIRHSIAKKQKIDENLISSGIPISLCFFCDKRCDKSTKRLTRILTEKDIVDIRTNCTDDTASTIKLKIDKVNLKTKSEKYHSECFLEFNRKKLHKLSGRPIDLEASEAFAKICKFIENRDCVQYLLEDLHNQMNNLIQNKENCWTERYFQNQIENKFKDQISIESLKQWGAKKFLTFMDDVPRIIHDLIQKTEMINSLLEEKNIIKIAAQIIQTDIKSTLFDCDIFPTLRDISDGGERQIPQSLNLFLQELIINEKKSEASKIKYKKKCVALANAIITSVRPRSYVSPILYSLGLHLHRKYDSRYLLEVLSSLGFSVSYSEIRSYELATVASSTDIEIKEDTFMQFVYDNADFNVRTLDGFNTFHSMGGVVAIEPKESVKVETILLKKTEVTKEELGKFGVIPLKQYQLPTKNGLQLLKIENPLDFEIDVKSSLDTALLQNTLWICGHLYSLGKSVLWNGYMDHNHSHRNGTANVATITPLPFINCDASNPNTIYTALLYASEYANKFNQDTIYVTFDQPLFLKASEIVASASANSNLSKIVVRLGGFHLLMSYLGAIGYCMAGSGIEELWSLIYAKNPIHHMISGHAYSRAIRAHLLTQLALSLTILKDDDLNILEQDYLKELYGSIIVDSFKTDPTLKKINQLLHLKLNELQKQSRTAKLWVQYFHQIELVELFIRAERTGDFNLHLHCVKEMLPIFHAAGHLPYAKSAHLYLQQMLKLKNSTDTIQYEKLVESFAIRRTSKFWSGTWSDMIIEQTLMRSMKVSGGLTRGRGLQDTSLGRWVAAVPICFSIGQAFEEFVQVKSVTTDQHVEFSSAREIRDKNDLKKLVDFFDSHSPFNQESNDLISLSSGLAGDIQINCENAFECGSELLKEMVGNNFQDIKLKRSKRVKNLASVTNTIKIDKEYVVVDKHQLFNRIICCARSENQVKECFGYELSNTPSSLFDDFSLRKTNKAVLAKIIVDESSIESTVPVDSQYIVDGGFLIHKVVWSPSSTFDQIFNQYVSYLKHHYKNAKIVFDGYADFNSIKGEEHNRRSKKPSVEFIFTEKTVCIANQKDFLSNKKNKSQFIKALSSKLSSSGFEVIQSETDADYEICLAAIESAKERLTVVVGNDTDLLIILLGNKITSNIILLQPGDTKKRENKIINLKSVEEGIGDMANIILFVHAVTGCDSISAFHRIGKQKAFKMLKKEKSLRKQLEIFYDPTANVEDLLRVGESFIVKLYNSGTKELNTFNLNESRFFLYNQHIARRDIKTTFDLGSLPPTRDAARFHLLRVYYQIQIWLGNKEFDPCNYGWERLNEKLLPIKKTLPPAPSFILETIFCNCKQGCGAACSCRKVGLNCSPCCKNCLGITCTNSIKIDEDDENNV